MSNVVNPSRRLVVGRGFLSAAAVGLIAGAPALAAPMGAKKDASSADVAILNVALALEHEAIEAYQIGAESGLVTQAVLPTAVLFQSHHKAHRDALVATIGQLGGKPVGAKKRADYEKSLNVAALKSEADVLKLAAKLELGAANAYLGVIPSFMSKDLAKVSARLAADETMHWTALAQALGQSIPQAALSFGA
ncbi:MAG: ferritin-like domain-containing protein [Parvularculaceae bacterium]